VFVVGYLGDWRPAAEVLFEPQSLRGNPAPSRQARQGVAGTLKGGSGSRGYPDPSDGNGGGLTVVSHDPAPCLETTSHDYSRADGFTMIAQPIVCDTTNITSPQNGSNPQPGDPCFTLAKGQHPPLLTQPMAFDGYNQTLSTTSQTIRSDKTDGDHVGMVLHGVAQPVGFTRCDHGGDAVIDGTPTMRCGSNYSAHLAASIPNMAVRRLTPVECERLQGFPDNYTNIPWRKQPESPDGPRYKALGNSMAVPVMAWIGRRIAMYNTQSARMVA
jgi:DNA (cytosine-5)-methyltransferase 1